MQVRLYHHPAAVAGALVVVVGVERLAPIQPADRPRRTHCHCPCGRVASDTRMFQHTPRVLYHMVSHDSPLKLRRPPQSNCPPGTVPHPDDGMGLGSKHNQSGISPLAPPTLTRQLHSLPLILHRLCPNTMPSCSKAPRGLFVLLRVGRIFTAISISPGPSSRQCSNCYAVRAGRNFTMFSYSYERRL